MAFLFRIATAALVCSYIYSFLVHLYSVARGEVYQFDPPGESPAPRPSHSLDNFVSFPIFLVDKILCHHLIHFLFQI